MKKLSRKQVETFLKQFDVDAYAQCTHDRKSLMVSLPMYDIAGYGGTYANALLDMHIGATEYTAREARMHDFVMRSVKQLLSK